jgi:formylmethanofuran dehydrogenase subunit E
MARVLLLIILFGIVYFLGRRFINYSNQKPPQQTSNSSEKMVKCRLCEAYIPESESMLQNQESICKNQPCKK